jgi:hypothetical protein
MTVEAADLRTMSTSSGLPRRRQIVADGRADGMCPLVVTVKV